MSNMQNILSTQYDDFAEGFSASHDIAENGNRENRRVFYEYLNFVRQGDKLLDLGCGDGLDMVHYAHLGAEVCGIDASAEMIKLAKSRLPNSDIRVGLFEQLPYQNNTFDVILSRYAIQTSADVAPCLEEMHRVLKPGGTVVFLVVHPFRQYFEKKDSKADYFEQKVVDSRIFNNKLVVKEPTHTFSEYLSPAFLKKFDIAQFGEYWDAAAEQIEGKKYPGYFIIKATKRHAPLRLAVLSSASDEVSPQNKELAESIGAYLAQKGIVVVTGGCRGIPGLVVASAFKHGATTEAYSPDTDEDSHHKRTDNLALSYFSKHNFVPGFTARSLQMLKNIDGVLVLNGRMGTLSEFTIALEEGVPAAVITSSGGMAEHLPDIVRVSCKTFEREPIFETDYKAAIDALISAVAQPRSSVINAPTFIEIKQSPIHGMGAFATKAFKKGETVVIWDSSRLLSQEEFAALPQEQKPYVANLGGKLVLMRSPAKFINHSCTPNIAPVEKGRDVALRDIEAGEEIVADYLERKGNETTRACKCNSAGCKKLIVAA